MKPFIIIATCLLLTSCAMDSYNGNDSARSAHMMGEHQRTFEQHRQIHEDTSDRMRQISEDHHHMHNQMHDQMMQQHTQMHHPF